MWQSNDMQVVSIIDTIDEYYNALIAPIKERHSVEALATVIIHFDCNGIDGYDEMVMLL